MLQQSVGPKAGSVQFQELCSQSHSYVASPLKQHFICVAINSNRQPIPHIHNQKPQTTRHTDGKTTRKMARETTKGCEFGVTAMASHSPGMQVSSRKVKGTKETASLQTCEQDWSIDADACLGVAWWGFTVQDSYLQVVHEFIEEHRPTTDFRFNSPSGKMPDCLHIEVASYWFSEQMKPSKSGRLHKLTMKKRKCSPYYNLCHIAKLEVPSNMTVASERIQKIRLKVPVDVGKQRVHYDQGDLPLQQQVWLAEEKYHDLTHESDSKSYLFFDKRSTYAV